MAHYENGKYRVRITEYACGKSPVKRTSYIRFYVEVLGRLDSDGSFDAVAERYERELTVYLNVDWSVEKSFAALGSELSLEPDWLIDKEKVAYCIRKKSDDGKVYEEWSFFQPGSGKRQEVDAMSDKERRTAEAKLKQRLGIKDRVATPTQVEQEAATADEDDFPF